MHIAILALLYLWPAGPSPTATDIVPDSPVVKFDEIGLYKVGYAYRGRSPQFFPFGWSGDFDSQTGVACHPAGEQNGKAAFLLHCPWRNGTGIAFQEFRVSLPKARRIVLRGATAMRADIVGKSDGVTFRVAVDGRKLLDSNQTDSSWRPFAFDLTSEGGKTVTVRFETDPGPRDNPSFDFSLWGDREIVFEGFQPAVRPHPAPPPLALEALRPSREGGTVPPNAFGGADDLKLEGSTPVFRYTGRDGTLEYRWFAATSESDPWLGRFSLRALPTEDTPSEVPLATSAAILGSDGAPLQATHGAGRRDGVGYVRTFRLSGGGTLSVRAHLEGKSLVVDVSCDRPAVAVFDGGGWGPTLRRRQVATPYYSGQVYYLPAENLFVNAALDWTASSATSLDQNRARYEPLTDGSRNLPKERMVYTAAWHPAEVLPNIPNAPSPYLEDLGGRIVLDIWGGRYPDIARKFQQLANYGISDCVALIHDWQRSGYDNALPVHIPAASDKGGDAGMKALVETGKRLGFRVALHENYVDYYPNYDLFDASDIALDSAGSRQKAWFNPGTKIQSFAEKPSAILRLAGTQSPEIHRRYGTNAGYLDVHSAVPPWFHVDLRAGEEGAGEFRRVWDVHRALWEYERKTHGGPVFGEGANHWYWSGCLDGVEAQFGVGWLGNGGMSAPLAVDFDLLKIHPLQLNHGMGYYERWWSNPQWGAVPPVAVLDQYRMQEVAYGHAGFLSGSAWSLVPLAWLEHDLMTPVTSRYATARVVAVDYEIGGKWVDGTAAAKAGVWDRVRVRYDDGLTVTANNAAARLHVGGLTLPRFGWVAQGAGVTAWTALRHGSFADYAETATSVFANARSAADWNLSGVRRIRPEVAAFEQLGLRSFRATYRWLVGDRLTEDYECFVHFSRPGDEANDEGIRFQNDHQLTAPTSKWKPGDKVMDGPYTITIPDFLPDGDYEWSIGLYTATTDRLTMEGPTDRHGRVSLGMLHLRDGILSFEPEKRTGGERLALYKADLNADGAAVDFGTVLTDGSVYIVREGADWVLRTLPRERRFLVELDDARFGRPPTVVAVGGERPAVTPIAHGKRWRLPLNGAREYRWAASGPSKRNP